MPYKKIFRAFCAENDTYIDIPVFTYVSGQNASRDGLKSLSEMASASAETFYDLTGEFMGTISSNYVGAYYGADLATSWQEWANHYGIPVDGNYYHYYFDEAQKYGFKVRVNINSTPDTNWILNGVSQGRAVSPLSVGSNSNTSGDFFGFVGDVSLSNNYYVYAYFTADNSTTNRYRQQYGNTSFYSIPAQVIVGSGAEPYEPPADPYEKGGGSSTTGGGTGTFSETGDIVGIPGLPTLSAVDTGFITLFNPTAAQVKQLAAYMWSNSFDMATFKNIVANPIDCILGLTIVPVNPPDAGTKAVSVGNIATDVNMPYLSSQYVEVDCGTLNVQEFWGSYLDYSPYTKMSLYLPYIGIVPLDIDDVMNATITIKYHVDVLSGACVAYVLCNGTQLYTYIGQCSSNVPITSNDFTNTVNGILGIAGSIGSLVATGGASAPTEIGKIAGNAINALKPNVQKSGAMSGTGGLMGVQTPYLICQRPRQSVPASQNTFTGYPSNITATLSDLSGYTEVDKIHLEGVPCTNEEMDEIMTLLESGVYI